MEEEKHAKFWLLYTYKIDFWTGSGRKTSWKTVVESWQNGQITAREAMAQLELKPNTFYRRIKAREAQKKKDYRKAGQELRSEEKKAARQTRHELDALKKQIRAEAREMKKLTSD